MVGAQFGLSARSFEAKLRPPWSQACRSRCFRVISPGREVCNNCNSGGPAALRAPTTGGRHGGGTGRHRRQRTHRAGLGGGLPGVAMRLPCDAQEGRRPRRRAHSRCCRTWPRGAAGGAKPEAVPARVRRPHCPTPWRRPTTSRNRPRCWNQDRRHREIAEAAGLQTVIATDLRLRALLRPGASAAWSPIPSTRPICCRRSRCAGALDRSGHGREGLCRPGGGRPGHGGHEPRDRRLHPEPVAGRADARGPGWSTRATSRPAT